MCIRDRYLCSRAFLRSGLAPTTARKTWCHLSSIPVHHERTTVARPMNEVPPMTRTDEELWGSCMCVGTSNRCYMLCTEFRRDLESSLFASMHSAPLRKKSDALRSSARSGYLTRVKATPACREPPMRRYLRCPGAICCPARRALTAACSPSPMSTCRLTTATFSSSAEDEGGGARECQG